MSRDAARPTLLYLPGLDGTGRLLYRQTALHDSYHVLCEAYPQDRMATYEQLADTAAQHLAEANGGRPGVVLAESFGGAVALTLALRRPELVERLVLVNTFAYFRRRLLINLASLLGPWLPRRPGHPGTRGVRGWFFFAPGFPVAEQDEVWQRTADVPLRAFGQRIRLIEGLDLRPRLGQIDIPALVIVSRDDRVVTPPSGRHLARLLPRARLLEVRTGHAALVHPTVNIARLLADPAYWGPIQPQVVEPRGSHNRG